MAAGRTIVIAGAGIAGLTLALALAKFGATIVVLEKAATLPEQGVGLQLSPNARRVLNQLGLDRALASASFEPAGIDIYPFRRPAPLLTLELGAAARQRYGVPYAVMLRSDLAQLIHKACKRFANIEIVFGVKSFDAATHMKGVTVVTDEGDGKTRTLRAHALVGADGVNSLTRTRVLEGPEAAYSGFVAWRTLLHPEAIEGVLAPDRVSMLFAPHYHAVVYPLPHRKAVNVALFAKEKPDRAFALKTPDTPNIFKSMYRSKQFEAILAAGSTHWSLWPMSTIDDAIWHRDSVGLIGDAAHAMLPFQAQGAAMAIEDAAILAPLLVTEPEAAGAFERYTAMRRERVRSVATLSRRNAFAFHLEWPWTYGRDTVLRLQGPQGHFKRLDWIYSFDPSPEVEAKPAPVR